jgi:hypothetical protein
LPNRTIEKAFGRAHDVRGANRLVGADQHEILHALLNRQFCHAQCPDRIVPHAFQRIMLDQGNMLVGGGVKNRLRTPGPQNPLHPVLIDHRPEQRHKVMLRAIFAWEAAEVAMYRIESEFAGIDKEQLCRADREDLAAQFAAD